MPISLEQKESIGTTENITVTVHHITQPVNDTISINEPTIVRTIDREATLQQEVKDLTSQLQLSDVTNKLLTVLVTIVGIGATFGGYLLSRRHLESTIDKSVEKTVTKMVEIVNAQLRITGDSDKGQVGLNKEGKAMTKRDRSISEPHVPNSDSLNVTARRWHSDPTGKETAPSTGEKGYYTD